MFHGAIEKIIVASFYGPRYIEGNCFSIVHLQAAKQRIFNCSCKDFLSEHFAENRMTL